MFNEAESRRKEAIGFLFLSYNLLALAYLDIYYVKFSLKMFA